MLGQRCANYGGHFEQDVLCPPLLEVQLETRNKVVVVYHWGQAPTLK